MHLENGKQLSLPVVQKSRLTRLHILEDVCRPDYLIPNQKVGIFSVAGRTSQFPGA